MNQIINAFALACLAIIASSALAQTQAPAPAPPGAPATQPAPAKAPAEVVVRELLILVVEPGQTHANHESAFKQTLPVAPGSRRTIPTDDERLKPMGGGLIAIDGPDNTKLELTIGIQTSRFIAAYPTPDNQVGTITWRAVSIAAPPPIEPQKVQPVEIEKIGRVLEQSSTAIAKPPANIAVPAGHWITTLREKTPRLLATQRRQIEACLFYDVAVEFPFPVKIEGEKDAYTLTSQSKTPLRDVQMIKPDTSGRAKLWSVKEIAPSATIKPEPQTASDADTRDKVFNGRREQLIARGHAVAEADHAVAALKALAWQDRFLTVVYTLDGDELSRMLPLTVTPKPGSVLRTALVIVRNADPAVAGELDSLIAQLGAPEWEKRAEATRQLATLGGLARAKLQEATKHKDVEIALRAERLLEAIDPQRNPNVPERSGRAIIRGGDGSIPAAGVGAANPTVDLIAE